VSRQRTKTQEPERIRVAVVLGRCAELIGRGLVQILQEDEQITVIARDLDVRGLERIAAQSAPVVAVLEDGAASSLQLKALTRSVPTIVLAHRPNERRRKALRASGAICVATHATALELLMEIRLAAGSVAVPLTPRELEVLGHIRSGKTSKEIAQSMYLGVETVRTYTTAIRRKLGVKSKRELIHGAPARAK
jgi:DNA-binding CsgD family transcriptional regulator